MHLGKYGVISFTYYDIYDKMRTVFGRLTPVGWRFGLTVAVYLSGSRGNSVRRLKICDRTIPTVDALNLPRVDSICSPVLRR